MDELKQLLVFPTRLDQAGLDYMITGSVAGMLYGEPRMTYDVDLVVALRREQLPALTTAFPEQEFYCPPIEAIRIELERETRGHFNLISLATGLRADIYLTGQDQLHRWAFTQRRQITIENTTLWLAPPEYVIVRKLEYYREAKQEKHLRDIQKILAISPDLIDRAVLNEKIKDQGLTQVWKEIEP